jgi:hypothetical protein
MRVEVDGSDVPERHLAVVRARSDSTTRHPCDGVVHGTPGGLMFVVVHRDRSLRH